MRSTEERQALWRKCTIAFVLIHGADPGKYGTFIWDLWNSFAMGKDHTPAQVLLVRYKTPMNAVTRTAARIQPWLQAPSPKGGDDVRTTRFDRWNQWPWAWRHNVLQVSTHRTPDTMRATVTVCSYGCLTWRTWHWSLRFLRFLCSKTKTCSRTWGTVHPSSLRAITNRTPTRLDLNMVWDVPKPWWGIFQ